MNSFHERQDRRDARPREPGDVQLVSLQHGQRGDHRFHVSHPQRAAKRMIAAAPRGPHTTSGRALTPCAVMCRKFNGEPEKASRPMEHHGCGLRARLRRRRPHPGGAGNGKSTRGEDLRRASRRGRQLRRAPERRLHDGAQPRERPALHPRSRCRCGISVADVDAINGHLTATFADPYEVKNWAVALERTPANFPWINATKSLVGHCLGGAGAVESSGSCCSSAKGFIHPPSTARMLHPEIAPLPAHPQTMIEDAKVKIIAKGRLRLRRCEQLHDFQEMGGIGHKSRAQATRQK